MTFCICSLLNPLGKNRSISETGIISCGARGFTLGGSLYSIYKKEYPALSDVLFILGIVAGAVLVVVL